MTGKQRPFWENVQRGTDNECWPWLRFRKPSGHGLTSYKGLPINASRKAWILTHGPIQSELCVNHRCDNSACCNPAHLYLGTRTDNMIDLWFKTPAGERMGGRKAYLSESELTDLWEMRRCGATLRACGERFGVHFSTIARYITNMRKEKLAKYKLSRVAPAMDRTNRLNEK